jgi:hypothetical protein
MCETCEKVQDGLSKCTGCESVAYCGKVSTIIVTSTHEVDSCVAQNQLTSQMQECQVKGWTELGHKSDCKIIKSIKGIWN